MPPTNQPGQPGQQQQTPQQNPGNPAVQMPPYNPAPSVNDPSQPAPFSLGTPSEQPQQPQQQPQKEEVPEWAKQFMGSVDEKFTNLESKLTEEPGQPTDPNAPIGSQPQQGQQQTPQSELAQINPKNWEDVDKYVNTKIQQGVEQGIQGFTQDLQNQNEQAEDAKAKVDSELDQQVDSLQSEGVLPAIQNPNDRNDPGRIARRELYGAAAKLGTTDLKTVATMVLAPIHQQGKMYDPISDSYIDYQPQQQVPGANAPIGSSSTTTGQSSNQPSYQDIHKARSLTELRERAGL